MKKLSLLLLALVVSVLSFGQTNLALKGSGANAYASSEEKNNDGTGDVICPAEAGLADVTGHWGSNYNYPTAEEDNDKNKAWWYVDLGSVQSFNYINISYNNEAPVSAQVYLGSDDGAGGITWAVSPILNLTTTEPANAGDNKAYTYAVGEQTARYIKYQGVKAGGYGFGFNAFSVYNLASAPTLNEVSASIANATILKNTTSQITVSATDNLGGVLNGTVAYSGYDTDVISVSAEGLVKGLAAGSTTITVTFNGDATKQKTIDVTVTNPVLPATAPAVPTGTIVPVYSNGDTSKNGTMVNQVWDNAIFDAEYEVDGSKMLHAINVGTFIVGNTATPFGGAWIAYNPIGNGMGAFHADVYSAAGGTLNMVLESNVGGKPNTTKDVVLTAGAWTPVDIDLTSLDDEYVIKCISFKGSALDIFVTNIYFTKASTTPELTSVDASASETQLSKGGTATITATAQDQFGKAYAAATISYSSSNPAVVTVDEGTVNAIGFGNATVTVKATEGETTKTKDIVFTVIPSEPTPPTTDADKVDAIYSSYYTKGVKDQNAGWGGGPNPLWKSHTPLVVGGTTLKHVLGTGYGDRPENALTTDYCAAYIVVCPTTATKGKIYYDNGYASATEFDLTPGDWNYVTLPLKYTTNYVAIELVGETDFYLGHLYFAKDLVAPTIDDVTSEGGYKAGIINVKATDDVATTLTYKIYKDDDETPVATFTGESGEAVAYSITGLSDETTYNNYKITVSDGTNTTEKKEIPEFTTLASFPEVPDGIYTSAAEKKKVLGVYGTYYGNHTRSTWNKLMNEQTAGEDEQIGAKVAFKIPEFRGYYVALPDKPKDSGYADKLHVDIYSQNNSSVVITPIFDKTGGNYGDVGLKYELVAGKWNRIEINLSDLFTLDNSDAQAENIYFRYSLAENQTKGSNYVNGDGTNTLYIGNVYFHLDGKEPVYPEFTSTSIFGSNTSEITIRATAESDGDEAIQLVYYLTENGEGIENGQSGTTEFVRAIALAEGDKTEHTYKLAVINTQGNSTEVILRGKVHTVFTGELSVMNETNKTTANAEGYYHEIPGVTYLQGDWDYEKFHELDMANPSKAYDVRYVNFGSQPQVDLDNLALRPLFPNCLFICNGYGRFNQNYVMMVDETDPSKGYRAQNLKLFDTDKSKATIEAEATSYKEANSITAYIDYSKACGIDGFLLYDMNTQISPIIVETGVNFWRHAGEGSTYVSMMIPYTAPVAELEGVTVYDLTAEDTDEDGKIIDLTFEPVSTMEAGKAYIAHMESGNLVSVGTGATMFDFTIKDVPGTANAVMKGIYETTSFVGSTEHLDSDDEMYGLSYKDATDITLSHLNGVFPAFRAAVHLKNHKAHGAKAINVYFIDNNKNDDDNGNGTTSVRRLATEEEIQQIFNIYSIDGRLVKSNATSTVDLPKGLYIMNGKKVLVK